MTTTATPQTDAELREIFRKMDPRAAQQIRANYYKAVEGLQSLATALEMADLDLGSPYDARLITEHLWACQAMDAMRQSHLGRIL